MLMLSKKPKIMTDKQKNLLCLKNHIAYEVNEVREYIKCLATEKADKKGATEMLIKNCFIENDRLGSAIDLLGDIEILLKRQNYD